MVGTKDGYRLKGNGIKRGNRGTRPGLVLIIATTVIALALTSGAEPVPSRHSQKGVIKGTVVDSETGGSLVGVSIYVRDTELGAIGDIDGNYTVKKIPPGFYTIEARMVGYSPVTVTQVEVRPGEETVIDLLMARDVMTVDGIVVSAKMIDNTEAAMLKYRQTSRSVTDAISAEQISRSGSGDAAEAMTKVVGVSVMDGKFVFVRGLGDRYGHTQLNGSLIPTSDPEKQGVPMDMIPSGLLDNIVVTKSYTPDKPGNFSGGSVDIHTKEFPDMKTLRISASAGRKPQVTGNNDYLTFTKGSLEIPTAWNTQEASSLGNDWPGFTRDQAKADFVNSISQSFNKHIRLAREPGPVDRSYAGSFSNTWSVWEKDLGVSASLSYSRSHSFYDDGVDAKFKLSSSDNEDSELIIQHYLHDTKATQSELYGGFANLSAKVHSNHKLGATYYFSRRDEIIARFLEGGAPTTFSLEDEDTSSSRLEARVLEYNERTMHSIQFKGEHAINLGGLAGPARISWHSSFSKAGRETPDQRFFNQKVSYEGFNDDGKWVRFDEPVYKIDPTDVDILPSRYFRSIEETNGEYGLDLTLPVASNWTLKTGFSLLNKDRRHDERLFVYTREGEYSGDPEDYYSSMGYNTTFYVNPRTGDTSYTYSFVNFINESTTPNEQYRGSQDILGLYAMVEVRPWARLTVVAGARSEKTDMFVENRYNRESADYIGGYASGTIEESDWLPSANVVYKLTETMNLRTAYGLTLARPTIREFAPYGSFDFGASGKTFNGNPDLQRILIDNFDLRWEWFVRPGEILAVSGFYKKFTNPIELAIVSTNEDQIMPVNTDEARLYGVEIEARTGLEQVHPSLRNFGLGLNITITDSRVDIPEAELIQQRAYRSDAEGTRPMYGQAPYIINASLSYSNALRGTSVSLHYNRVGERFAVNAPGGTPDIYQQPRDILDLIASKSIFRSLMFKLSAKNLLDSKHEEMYRGTDFPYRRYGTGRSFSLGVSMDVY